MNERPPLPDTRSNLIWIDLEMTGLDTVNDRIIEVATIVRSFPSRFTSAVPNGISYNSSGTGPFIL